MALWPIGYILSHCLTQFSTGSYLLSDSDGSCLFTSCGGGAFKCYVTQMGWGVSTFPGKLYEGVRFNVISVTKVGMGEGPISRQKALRNT